MSDAIKIIKDELARIDEARAMATQGEWHPCGCRHTMINTELNSQEILDVCEVVPTDYTSDHQLESNKQFIALAANEITNLTKALSVAVEHIRDINHGFSKSGLRYGGIQYEQISAKALTTIANILSGKDGK